MSIDTRLIDPTTGAQAKIAPVGPYKENAVWVNIANASPNLLIPNGPSASGIRYEGSFSLDGDETVFDLNVNGAVTNKTFLLYPPDENNDLMVTDIIVIGRDVTVTMPKFFGSSIVLANGCEFSAKTSNVVSSAIGSKNKSWIWKTTQDLLEFASTQGFDLYAVSGGDIIRSCLSLAGSMVLRAQYTYGGTVAQHDYLKIMIKDDITAVDSILAYARGILYPKGTI